MISSSHHFDVNEGNNKQETVLHLAAAKGFTDIVSYLITIDSEIDSVDSEGRTPLIIATE